MSKMLEELVSGTPAEAAEKLAGLTAVSRGLRKQGFEWKDLHELGNHVASGAQSFGNTALKELKSGNPLYTGAAGALAGAGAGLTREIMNPEDNDYNNVLTSAGIGGALGASGGLAYRALQESTPPPADPGAAVSMSKSVGGGIRNLKSMVTGNTEAVIPPPKVPDDAPPGPSDWYNVPAQVVSELPNTTAGAAAGWGTYGLRKAYASQGAAASQLSKAIDAAGNPQIVGQSSTGLLGNRAALEELARRNTSSGFPGVRNRALNQALNEGLKVKGAPAVSANDVRQFARSMGGPAPRPFLGRTGAVAPMVAGALLDLYRASQRKPPGQ